MRTSYTPRHAEMEYTPRHASHHGFPRKVAGTCLALIVAVIPIGSEHSLDASKPVGPYATSLGQYQEDMQGLEINIIPAKKTPGIELSDTFDERFTTNGYGIIVDQQRISKELRPNEIASIVQYDEHIDTDPEYYDVSENRIVILSEDFNDSASHPGFLVTADQVKQWQKIYNNRSINLLGIDSSGSTEGGILPNGKQILGSGITPSTTRSTLEYNVTRFNPDGTISTTSKSAAVTFSNNVLCDASSSNKVSTEVELTPSQHDVVCNMLKEYSTFLENYQIILDSTVNSVWNTDQQSKGSRSIILTYPYSAGEEVSPDMFKQIALHEILHAAYEAIKKDDTDFRTFSDAFRNMKLIMDYKMPDIKTQMISSLTVRDVEAAWGALTESTYIDPKSLNGHPWDNPTEMLSSTAAVLAFYPTQFEKRFDTLSSNQQAATYTAVDALKQLFEHYNVEPDRIIPGYSSLQERLLKRMESGN